MHKPQILIGALLVLACLGCTQAPPSTDAKAGDTKADTKAKDIADIKALEDKFVAAFRAKDVNAIMAVYVPDQSLVVFDAVPPRQYVGAEAYHKDFEGFLALCPGPIEFNLSDLDITADGGDIAFGHSIQQVSGNMKNGKKLEFTVRVTDGYKKTNGQWLIAHEHVSVPADILTGKADLNSKP